MAIFEPAYQQMQKNEGGYVNDPLDRGGETYRGISRKNWRGWEGWPIVDAATFQYRPLTPGNIKSLNAWLSANAPLQKMVRLFYFRNFWTPTMERLKSQELANWLFDKGVTMGVRQACKLLQRAACVDEDGIIGPQSMAAVNAANPDALLEACRQAARGYYTNIALHDPTQTRFLQGWLARA